MNERPPLSQSRRGELGERKEARLSHQRSVSFTYFTSRFENEGRQGDTCSWILVFGTAYSVFTRFSVCSLLDSPVSSPSLFRDGTAAALLPVALFLLLTNGPKLLSASAHPSSSLSPSSLTPTSTPSRVCSATSSSLSFPLGPQTLPFSFARHGPLSLSSFPTLSQPLPSPFHM